MATTPAWAQCSLVTSDREWRAIYLSTLRKSSHGGQANRMGTNWEREPGCPSPVDQFLILVILKKKVSDL
jgi:hypothetical protein